MEMTCFFGSCMDMAYYKIICNWLFNLAATEVARSSELRLVITLYIFIWHWGMKNRTSYGGN